jgi:hypothetical protein
LLQIFRIARTFEEALQAQKNARNLGAIFLAGFAYGLEGKRKKRPQNFGPLLCRSTRRESGFGETHLVIHQREFKKQSLNRHERNGRNVD